MVSVTLDGTNIDHLVLDEDITVRVGRTGVLDLGEPGSASLELYLAQWVPVSYKSLVVITDSGVRFSGRVTDTPRTQWVEHPDDPDKFMMIMRLQCAGPLAAWGRQRVGETPWPEESVAARAARIAAIVDRPLIVQGGAPLVIARDVDSQPAIDLISDLATDCAGFLFDHAGNTYLQSLESRRLNDPQERWNDQTTTWDGWLGSWNEQTETSGAAPRMVSLPPDAVLFAPQIEQTSRLANRVTVMFGAEDASGYQSQTWAEDAGSLAMFGPEDVKIVTRLADPTEAYDRALLTLERAAYPQWHLPRVEVMWEALDGGTAGALSGMLPGGFLEVTGIPQPGPFQAFQGCVEGWTDQWSWDDTAGAVLRTTTYHLSDMRWSFAVVTWSGIVPDTLTWDAIDCAWDDMLTADDLEV